MNATAAPVQTGRLITLTTPLGGDVLIGMDVKGREALSELFEFAVDMASTNTGITADQLIGKSVTVSIARPGSDARAINGIVTYFAAGDQMVNGMRRYRVVLRPKLWLLTRTADCRIFQNQSVVQIADTLLSDGGVTDYKKVGLSGTHPTRDYCVQYRETDYEFLVRILAEEGIYFYFQHESGQHTLILSDSVGGYTDCVDKSVQHAPPDSSLTQAVQNWSSGFHFQSGKATLDDFNFEQSTTDLTASTSTAVSNSAFKSWEVYDYPGDYTKKDDGTTLSRTRMEAIEAGYAVTRGSSTYPGFMPGAKFTMAKHEVSGEQGKSYVLRAVEHSVRDHTHLGNHEETVAYANDFAALPATTVFRPRPVTRRPLIPGHQTATVVGASGDEIYCDKYGRIRVQFHWDRLGKNDENSSCWIRVAQSIAGATWGSQFLPRVGMEVVVAFLEGDPDRPLVVGSVYNGQNMPPYTLPDNKTQSGIKTRSSTQGSATTFNELRFEDKKGSELVYIHAQKDFTRDVVNDDKLNVEHDRTETIKNDRSATIQEGNESLTVSKGNRSVTVSQGNDSLTVSKGNRTATVSEGNDSLTVAQGNRTATISKGNDTTTLSSGNYSLSLSSGNATMQCDGGSVTISAGQSITLKVGSNSITINQSGITLKGTQIAVTGDAKVQLSGPMVNVSGSGTVQVKGGLVTIN